MVSKEGHSDCFLRHKKDQSLFISLKTVQMYTVLPVGKSLGKIHLVYWM